MAETDGNLARVLRLYRMRADLTQDQVAEKSGRGRTWISTVENGGRLPKFEGVLQLADILGAPAVEFANAWFQDTVAMHRPDLLPEIEAERDGRIAAWEKAARDRLRVAHGEVLLQVNESGDLDIERRYTGCTTRKSRRKVVYRDRIVGESPTRIDVVRAPSHKVTSRTNKLWREHVIRFDADWDETSEPIDVVFRVTVPGAYLPGNGGAAYRRRQKAEHRPTGKPFGFCQYDVRNAFERLRMSIRLAEVHEVEWLPAIATVDQKPLDDDDHLAVADICRHARWISSAHAGLLEIDRPLPGHSIFLRWDPRVR